jgi:hypothetical protein
MKPKGPLGPKLRPSPVQPTGDARVRQEQAYRNRLTKGKKGKA